MVSFAAAFPRLKRLSAFSRLAETDFRPMVYPITFSAIASGADSSALPQVFSGGAIILGVTSSAYVASTAAASQPAKARQFYGLSFSMTNGDSYTGGTFVNAEALLGGGEDNTLFPLREIVMAPNQQLNAQARNFSTSSIIVTVAYHCMIYRVAG